MLQSLIDVDDLSSCKHLLLENASTLIDSKRGVLLLRKEFVKEGRPIFISVKTEDHDIELVCGSFLGITEKELEKFSKDAIKKSLLEGDILFEKPFLYSPLGVKDRIIGELLLELEDRDKIDQEMKKILAIFSSRGALVLDRLYMKTSVKHEYEEKMRDLAIMKERLKLKHTDLELRFMGMGIIGHSEPMQKVYELIEKIAPLSVPILLQGETGTGKELFARAIHLLSPRKEKPFLAINCAAMPEPLLDSELFGHMKGSFTGADRDHKGLFEAAHQGSLFLDEIEEMSDAMQKKLLRAIETGEIRRVGGTQNIYTDVRIICATNKDIKEIVRSGRFREDLFYRLNIAMVNLPPLRERPDDIPLLTDLFVSRLWQDKGIPIRLEPSAIRKLKSCRWPGNVRELENVILRLGLLGKEKIEADDVGIEVEKGELDLERFRGKSLQEMERDFVRIILLKTLEELGWDIPAVCRALALPRSTLYRKFKEVGIASQLWERSQK
jgi:transcriptional regulator with GAF, ATPase, and Fis domain